MRLLPFLLGFWLCTATAQTPSYLHYTVRDGLPGNLVYCCLQDQRGLLWFGTDKGLACFDGIRFRIYGMSDGLPDPEVLSLKEDRQGRLWVFCFQKKPCYFYKGKLYTAREDEFLKKIDFNNGTNTILDDGHGGIWHMGFDTFCYLVEGNRMSKFKFPKNVIRMGVVSDTVLAFSSDRIARANRSGKIEIIYQRPKISGFPNMNVSGRSILYSYPDRLELLEYRNGKIRELDSFPHPRSEINTDRSGRFWVCSTTLGATCFDNNRQDLSNPVRYLPGKKVTAMMEDVQGTLWFCTIDEGVYALPRNAPITFAGDGFLSNNFRSLARSPGGDILAGDDVGTVHILHNDQYRSVNLTSPKSYNLVRQIISDADGTFYAASDNNLYECMTGYSRIINRKMPFSLKSMVMDGNKIWVAAATQLAYFDKETGKETKMIFAKRYTAIGIDGEKNVWAGGIAGLYSSRDSFMFNWGDLFPKLNNKIIAIQNAGNNKLWVATPNHGLLSVSVSHGAVTAVEVLNNSLKNPVNNIQSVYAEPGGRVWLATNRGVYGLDPQGGLLHFDAYNGLADNDVNAVLVHNDTLWAGTVSGLTRMLLRTPEGKADFATFITACRYQIENRVETLRLIDSTGHRTAIHLPADAANLEFELAGLDYRSRGNLRFQIVRTQQLLPFKWWTIDNLFSWITGTSTGRKDTLWIETGTYNLGTFVPPGRYKLQVTAVRPSGLYSAHPDSWVVEKPPYWYGTLWFYLLLWVAFGYGIWRMYKARMAFRNVRATASALQLQTLQAQLNPHFIGNAVNAIQQFLHPPDPLKASEYIALFMRLLRSTMQFSEKTFISIAEEIAYDREYLQMTQLRFEDRFQYEITGADFLPANTLIPAMLLQPILENATIHGISPEGISRLKMEFSFTGSLFCCEITDNGLGYNVTRKQKHLAGVERESKGIALLQKKIDSLNILYDLDMELTIQDLSEHNAAEHGTRVTLKYFPDSIWKAIKKLPPTDPISTGRFAP